MKELARHSTITMTSEYVHTASATNQKALEELCRGINITQLFPEPKAKGGHLREVL